MTDILAPVGLILEGCLREHICGPLSFSSWSSRGGERCLGVILPFASYSLGILCITVWVRQTGNSVGEEGGRESKGDLGKESQSKREREAERERKRKAGLIASGLGTPGDKNGPSHLVWRSFVLTDVLSTYRHTNIHTCYMCPYRCECLPVPVNAQMGLQVHVD